MTSPGFHRINPETPPVKLRFVGFVTVVVGGALILSVLASSSWNQLDRLQREHAAIKSESFYLGVTLRSSIRSLNGKLLKLGMAYSPTISAEFEQEALELRRLIVTNRSELAEMPGVRELRTLQSFRDLDLLQKIDTSFKGYLERTSRLLAPPPFPENLDSFDEVYMEVLDASRELLDYCDQLVDVQRAGFGEFLNQTQNTLANHKRLLPFTIFLILVLGVALAVLVYRGMISPLRVRLSRSENIIERQEKLASLGVLASGVAHEIRNPLTAIKFRLFSLKRAVPVLNASKDASVIENEINRLERIVKNFLRFARPSEPELRAVPVDSIIRDVHQLMASHLGRSRIHLELDLQEGAMVQADPDQFKQVLINLVQNASDAIRENGVITIQTRISDEDVYGGEQPNLILSVVDTGQGISPEVQTRLFDPFFSTKEGGTGLGLAIAARIVEKHKGILRYETELNRGTVFEIVMPVFKHDYADALTDRG